MICFCSKINFIIIRLMKVTMDELHNYNLYKTCDPLIIDNTIECLIIDNTRECLIKDNVCKWLIFDIELRL